MARAIALVLGIRRHEADEPHPTQAAHDDLCASVALLHPGHRGNGADIVEVVASGAFLVGVPLQDREYLPVLLDRGLHRGKRRRPPDDQGVDQLRKDGDVL